MAKITVQNTQITVIKQAKVSEVTTPAIIVHSDQCAFPDNARQVFAALKGKKRLAWDGGGSHFDYYDTDAQVDYAVEQIAAFVREIRKTNSSD